MYIISCCTSSGFDAEVLPFPITLAILSGVVLLVRSRTRRTVGGEVWRSECQGCRYDLSGLESDARCPECGRHRAGRAELPGGTDIEWSTDCKRAVSYLALAAVLITVGSLRPLIWDARSSGVFPSPRTLAYQGGVVASWIAGSVVWAALAHWLFSHVRKPWRPRVLVVAILFTLIACHEILTVKPSMLRFEIAVESSALETVGAAYGIAVFLLVSAKTARVVWSAFRAWRAAKRQPAATLTA